MSQFKHLCSLCSIVNNILAHVIWKSFSFQFIQIKKTSQHFQSSCCTWNLILVQKEECKEKERITAKRNQRAEVRHPLTLDFLVWLVSSNNIQYSSPKTAVGQTGSIKSVDFLLLSLTQKQISFQLEDSIQAAQNSMNACDLRFSKLKDEVEKQQARISDWTILRDGWVCTYSTLERFYVGTTDIPNN